MISNEGLGAILILFGICLFGIAGYAVEFLRFIIRKHHIYGKGTFNRAWKYIKRL